MKLVGYANTWSVPPGGTISFMVSSEVGRYEAQVIRLIHGDTNPAGPGFKSQPVDSDIAGAYEGRFQPIRNGSYVCVPDDPCLELEGSFELELFIWPTTPDKPRQALLAKGGAFALALADGRLELRIADQAVRLDKPVRARNWYRVSAAYDADAEQAMLSLEPLEPTAFREAAAATLPLSARPTAPSADLLIAACEADDHPTDFFNGKIEAPRITRAGELLAGWDFAADISSRRIRDISGNGLDGRVVNMPTRAVTGRNWDGSETSWRHSTQQYGAIHFHDDDLDDAGWDVAFQWKLPDELPSGAYAVHLRAQGEEDHIPFFVRPKRGAPTAKILFLAPVFSYMAYANQQLLSHITYTRALPGSEELERARLRGEAVAGLREFIANEGPESPLAWLATYPFSAADRYMVENRLLGLYETHSDGSGVCYASWLRPLVNIRPDYRLGPDRTAHHQLPSDLYLIDWLSEHDYRFDVVTDVDLHLEGAGLLEPYQVVLTGSHPEYWSGAMLDALGSYLVGGGHLMYLGGNGLWFVTALDPDGGHGVEQRRAWPAQAGQFIPAVGEDHLSTTGELSGVWHTSGRAPNRYLGVGTFASGGGPGRPYERRPGSTDPRVAFIFDGIAENELIGDFPNLVFGPGAASFEFDAVDHTLGSPHETIVLASATGFSEHYPAFDVSHFHDSGFSLNHEGARADMTYLEYPHGGAVFSASSMCWTASLSYNNYDNNVSRITRNVLDRFATDA